MTKDERKEKKAPLLSFEYLFYDFVKLTAVIPGLIWLRPKRLYESENARKRIRGGCLIIANHSSFVDPVALMMTVWYRRQHFVCLDSFFRGWYRIFFKGFRCIPIDRADISMDAMRRIADYAASGRVVSLFPSGHVGGDAQTPAGQNGFKSGMVLMAMQSGRPIVPVYMKMPKKFSERLVAAVGEPIDPNTMFGKRPNMAQIKQISDLLWEKEQALKDMCESYGLGGNTHDKQGTVPEIHG